MKVTFTLPGTVIETKQNMCRQIVSSLFQTGGLMLSQVCTITGLETHTVQNWVKRGFVSSPVDKKYTKRQFCRIVIINMLKDVLPLDFITKLLSYINGVLNDDSDDLIDDSQLYLYFTDLLFGIKGEFSEADNGIQKVLFDYEEAEYGVKRRLEKVLKVMITAYTSAQLQKQAVLYLSQLDTSERSDLK